MVNIAKSSCGFALFLKNRTLFFTIIQVLEALTFCIAVITVNICKAFCIIAIELRILSAVFTG